VGTALKGNAVGAAKKSSDDPNDFFKERLLKPLPDFGGNRCVSLVTRLICHFSNFGAKTASCESWLDHCNGTSGRRTLTCDGAMWLQLTTPNVF
jgi:hypothetical protein